MAMKTRELLIIWTTVAALVAMLLCPPWVRVRGNEGVQIFFTEGYHWIGSPPPVSKESNSSMSTPDFRRLALQLLAVILAGAAALYTNRRVEGFNPRVKLWVKEFFVGRG
jgi:hypothetical protein